MRHVAMLTTFLVVMYLLSVVNGKSVHVPQQDSELSLRDKINKERCMFPPANLQIPDKCSELSLSSQVPNDLHDNNNIEFYLCVALLDSTDRLCHITKGNVDFGKRVSSALNDSLQSMIASSDDFCREMNIIDPDAKYPQAKFMYSQMVKYCPSICVGLGPSETAQREPICKSIQFAHQQIHTAAKLQNELNKQDQVFNKEREENSMDMNAAKAPGNNPQPLAQEKSVPPAVSQISQRASVQGIPGESRTSSNIDTASIVKSSEVQSSTGIQHANTAALHGIEGAHNAVQESKLIATIPPKKDKVLTGTAPVLPAKTNEKVPVVPGEINEKPLSADTNDGVPAPAEFNANEKAEGLDSLKTEIESPNLAQKSEEHTEDLKGDGNQNKNDPADAEDMAPQTEDTDNQDDFMKQDPNDGDDEDPSLPNGPLEPSRDVAEKSGAVEKKVSGAPLQPPQQKPPHASMMGNFEEPEDSHFFAYFMSLSALCILGYIVYHNKRKIIAMAVEGKKGRSTGRRRPNSASYHKLDSNLEEAMSSNLASTNSYVIY